MKSNYPSVSKSRISFFQPLAIALLLILPSTIASAQSSNTDGQTPAGLKPGAPAGAYSLAGFENVNLYNGNLNFSLPLLHVGGRGGAGYSASLVVEQKWRVETWPEPPPGEGPRYVPVGTWWADIKPGYGPGVLEGRRGGYEDYPNGNSLDRPTQIRRAAGISGAENQTTYDDVNRIITISRDRDVNNDNVLVSKVVYDQFGPHDRNSSIRRW